MQAFGWSFWGRAPETPTPLIQTHRFTLMIDPAGDGRDTGREIDGSFERDISLQCALELKKTLEMKVSGIRVILTRFAGETVEPLANAAFANRINPNLYMTIHFYEAKDKNPAVHLYSVVYNPGTDFWGKKADELALLPFDQAYKLSIKKTDALIKLLYDHLKKDSRRHAITVKPPLGLPFKPLMGISAPAVGIETGLKKKNDWQQCVPPLAESIEAIITSTIGT